MRKLFILRGVPGAGKSTIGEAIANLCLSADDYFTSPSGDEYKFDRHKVHAAHLDCLTRCKIAMEMGIAKIAVANTFTREWEFSSYLKLADELGYTVHTLIVENRHGSESTHGVPASTIQVMTDRFEVKL